MLVFAHAGHWIEGIIFGLPVAVLVIALVWDGWRTKRRGRRGEGG
jgi:hypothetical protein